MTVGFDINNSMDISMGRNDNSLDLSIYDFYNVEDNADLFEFQNSDISVECVWPMYCFNSQHTGSSPFDTADNPGYLKWWYKCSNHVEGSAAIDNNGVIYFSSFNRYFYALYPNGTLKWNYRIGGGVDSSGPAIDEDGIIYVGTMDNVDGDSLYAFYPNGTVKWNYFVGEWIYGSPSIGNNGMIYFSSAGGDPWHGHIYALYPNGTLKWSYWTGNVIYSDPAIGLDGTIYCGCHNGKLYALNPDDGTLKWSYNTSDWVARGPCIADEGTVIFGSWDGHLYACNPNGTLKWKTAVGVVTTPVIGNDGTIYVGSDYLSAINPENGSIKWQYDVPGNIRGGNPCISADGIIYCGTIEPGYLVAVNPDGTERWREKISSCYFAPVIGMDGTIYIGNSVQEEKSPGKYDLAGYFYAFNEKDPDAPSTPTITGPLKVKSKTEIDYTFKSTSPLGNNVYYYIDWGDGDWNKDWWLGPYGSGEDAVISHTWSEPGDYIIKSRCKDSDNLWSDWSEKTITVPRTKSSHWMRSLNMFPVLQRIIRLLK